MRSAVGTIASLWRYPVKSMLGEELSTSVVTERGLSGDRVFALVDRETGKVVSAKEPRKWARMFELGATYVETRRGNGPARALITLPDGTSVTSDLPNLNEILSRELGRDVALASSAPEAPSLEEYWPDIEGLAFREAVTDVAMPPGTFFDLGVVHILTTAMIDRLRELYPGGRFDVRRFRPNVVVACEERGFVENQWIGRTLALGDEVRLEVTRPCPRCVMTTLPQDDLPKDPGILRAAAKHNDANVGVYASVVRGGVLARGDRVSLE
jgi:uncharacterized protein YcbX